MMAKGSYGIIILATPDLAATFERIQATGAEVVEEPTDQPYGVRDCAVRDPAGNMIRIQQRALSLPRARHALSPSPSRRCSRSAFRRRHARASPGAPARGVAG